MKCYWILNAFTVCMYYFEIRHCTSTDTHVDEWNALNSNCRIEKQSTLNVLLCDKFDSLDVFPNIPAHIAERISHVSIKNQPRIKILRSQDLKNFTNLSTFSLTDSGLNVLELFNGTKNVFEPSSKTLNYIDLRHNAFETFNWRWFTGFKAVSTTLDIKDNPLQCSCSLHWLANWHQLNQPKAFPSPLGRLFNLSVAKLVVFPQHIRDLDSLECRDSSSGELIALLQWNRLNNNSCSLPIVNIQPKIINVSPDDNASFQCTIDTGQQNTDEVLFRPMMMMDKLATNKKLTLENTSVSLSVTRIDATVPRVSMDNMGWYLCVGKSISGPDFDLGILIVSTAPKINFIGSSGEPGKDIHFTFEIYGYPNASLVWLHKDQPISFKKSTPSELTFHTLSYTWVDRFYYQRQVFKVKILYNYPYYMGNYSLRGCNEIGCDEVLFAENINSSYFHEIRDRPKNIMPPVTTEMLPSINPQSTNILLVIIIVICVTFGMTICSVSVVCYLLKKRKYDKVSQRNRRDAKDLCALLGATEAFPLQNYSTNVIYQPVLSSDVPLIQRENVELIKEIGEGAFGKVYSAARLNGTNNECEKTPVAVKFLKNVTTERCEEFAREAELMAKLDHPNIVTFYGVCLDNADNNLLLLFEYMDLGDLKHFLAVHGPNPELVGAEAGSEPLSEFHLVSIAAQVASGLNYLHKKHFVHRDLASRNCLCQTPLTVKLSDFGMSRDIYSNDYYRLTKKAPLPVRWLPPESLVYGKFTSHSDIWSYGVVLWEIFSYGITPFCQLSNMEVLQHVTAGNVMEKPALCPDVLYDLMLSCWKKIPTERPSAENVLHTLSTYQTEISSSS